MQGSLLLWRMCTYRTMTASVGRLRQSAAWRKVRSAAPGTDTSSPMGAIDLAKPNSPLIRHPDAGEHCIVNSWGIV